MSELLSYRVRRLYNDRPNVRYVSRPWSKVINWGNGRELFSNDVVFRIINRPTAVVLAGNKLSTFKTLKDVDGIRIPEFTTDRGVADEWRSGKDVVVCRTQLRGHSGAGIILADEATPLVEAPLYVKYVKKQKEFRVHVAFGEVIDVQQKRKRRDLPEDFSTNFQIRNHQTGWVYCREDIVIPDGMLQMGIQVVQQLGLEFGAVDLIYNAKQDACYCLEVNTAPGLEGSTVDKYAEAFVRALT